MIVYIYLNYNLYYRYDDGNQEYVQIDDGTAPEWGSETFYQANFSWLNSEPADWANIYYNGDYYVNQEEASLLVDALLCKTRSQILSLPQKLALVEDGFTYSTTLPMSDNQNGKIKVIVCSEEPEYKYEGYMYIIIEN